MFTRRRFRPPIRRQPDVIWNTNMEKSIPGIPLAVTVLLLLTISVGCVTTSKYELEVARVAALEIKTESLIAELEKARSELTELNTSQAKLSGKHEFTKSKLADTESRVGIVRGRLQELLGKFSSYKLVRDQENEDLKIQWGSVQDDLVVLEARMKEVNTIFGEITAKMEALAASKSEQILAGEMALEAERQRVEVEGSGGQIPQSLGGR
jgi:predicted  nucleic acid-binding Zn-ribbon protein